MKQVIVLVSLFISSLVQAKTNYVNTEGLLDNEAKDVIDFEIQKMCPNLQQAMIIINGEEGFGDVEVWDPEYLHFELRDRDMVTGVFYYLKLNLNITYKKPVVEDFNAIEGCSSRRSYSRSTVVPLPGNGSPEDPASLPEIGSPEPPKPPVYDRPQYLK